MSEVKDSEIRLFGQTIPVSSELKYPKQPETSPNYDHHHHGSYCDRNPETFLSHQQQTSNEELQQEQRQQQVNKKHLGKQIIECQHVDGSSCGGDLKHSTTISGNSDNPKTPSVDREIWSRKSSSKNEGEQSETSNSQEKALKRPDKIVPCPRCNSMETKFCYHNNYNVNQPRHFCKNCQRYWTAGGTMRNVPVGAGRRKNKSSSASHYPQIMVSEALRTVQANGSRGILNHSDLSLGNNGTLLKFGSDSSRCESVLNLSEKPQNCERNRFHDASEFENGDDHSSGSSVTASNSSQRIKNYQVPVPSYAGLVSPYQWNNTPVPPPPSFYPSVQFYPGTANWGCALPGHWNMPYFQLNVASSQTKFTPKATPATPFLRKHSRDGNIITPANSETSRESKNSERAVLVPKTLRTDDPIPTKAAKSSVRATLGFKNEKSTTTPGEGLFMGFQTKSDDRIPIVQRSSALHANPAALSRSCDFHEST